MNNTNYFSGIVKILENPKVTFLCNKSKSLILTFRVEVSQVRKNKLITLNFWGNLAQKVIGYYQINDYILIEGYLSIKNKKMRSLPNKTNHQVFIKVLKIYPSFLNNSRTLI